MFRITNTACVEAPAHVVWAHLARLDAVHLWTDVIHRSYMADDLVCGVGAERVCELAGRRTLHERVIVWEEGRSFTYISTDAPWMKLARNRWSVDAVGARALATSEAELELRGGWFGEMLGHLLMPLLRLFLPNPLARFKYWVEEGRPYAGSARSLPVPPVACRRSRDGGVER